MNLSLADVTDLDLTIIDHPRPTQRAVPERPTTVPDKITIVLHFRIGEPLSHTRPRECLPGPTPIRYTWNEDDYDILCHKIQLKVKAIQQNVDVEWGRGSHPYLQRYNTSTANKYVCLYSKCCDSLLRAAWIKEFRRSSRTQDAVCNIYVYLQESKATLTAAPNFMSTTAAAAAPVRPTPVRPTPPQSAIAAFSEELLRHLGPIELDRPYQTAAKTKKMFRQMQQHPYQHPDAPRQRQPMVRKPLTVEIAGAEIQIMISVSELCAFLGLPEPPQ